jgi:hypothetical protein
MNPPRNADIPALSCGGAAEPRRIWGMAGIFITGSVADPGHGAPGLPGVHMPA